MRFCHIVRHGHNADSRCLHRPQTVIPSGRQCRWGHVVFGKCVSIKPKRLKIVCGPRSGPTSLVIYWPPAFWQLKSSEQINTNELSAFCLMCNSESGYGNMYLSISPWWNSVICLLEFLSNQTKPVQNIQDILQSNFKRNIAKFRWAIFQFKFKWMGMCDDWFGYEFQQAETGRSFPFRNSFKRKVEHWRNFTEIRLDQRALLCENKY